MSAVIIQNNVNGCMEAMKGAVEKALEMCGLQAESYAAAKCPVDTGRLRASITHRQIDDTTEAIGSDVEYAAYVELGTQKQKAQPYLKPAVEDHVSEYKSIFEGVLRG